MDLNKLNKIADSADFHEGVQSSDWSNSVDDLIEGFGSNYHYSTSRGAELDGKRCNFIYFPKDQEYDVIELANKVYQSLMDSNYKHLILGPVETPVRLKEDNYGVYILWAEEQFTDNDPEKEWLLYSWDIPKLKVSDSSIESLQEFSEHFRIEKSSIVSEVASIWSTDQENEFVYDLYIDYDIDPEEEECTIHHAKELGISDEEIITQLDNWCSSTQISELIEDLKHNWDLDESVSLKSNSLVEDLFDNELTYESCDAINAFGYPERYSIDLIDKFNDLMEETYQQRGFETIGAFIDSQLEKGLDLIAWVEEDSSDHLDADLSVSVHMNSTTTLNLGWVHPDKISDSVSKESEKVISSALSKWKTAKRDGVPDESKCDSIISQLTKQLQKTSSKYSSFLFKDGVLYRQKLNGEDEATHFTLDSQPDKVEFSKLFDEE